MAKSSNDQMIQTLQRARATLAKGAPTPRLREALHTIDARIAKAVASEVNVLRAEQRETAAKVDAAIARLDAALVRAETGGANTLRMVTR